MRILTPLLCLAVIASPAAQDVRDRVARELPWLTEPPAIVAQAGLHRVHVGPYATREAAQAAAERIQSSLAIAPLITNPKP